MRLNLGCGSKKLKGWVNVDIDKKVNPDLIIDLNKVPFKQIESNSIDEILLDNVVEHLDINLSNFFLEINRILKRNGYCHIILPNFFRWKARLHYLFGRFEDSDGWEVNHKILINPKVFREILRNCGFDVPFVSLKDVLFMPEINWFIRKREDL